jgi:hypothetical protein
LKLPGRMSRNLRRLPLRWAVHAPGARDNLGLLSRSSGERDPWWLGPAQGVRGAAAGGPQPQAGTQAALKHAGERFTTTEDRLGEFQALLDEACTGRDQALRERFAGRQAHERASAQVARLQRQVNPITSQLGEVAAVNSLTWLGTITRMPGRKALALFDSWNRRGGLRCVRLFPVLPLAATSPHPMAGSSRRCCAPMASGTW